jgi:hypothetical protein
LAEKLLLPVSLVIAALFDRLLFAPLFSERMAASSGIFWLCWLVIFYAFYWKRLRGNPTLWFVAGCSAALCVWQIIFNNMGYNNFEYGALTYFVIPAVLMAHAQAAARNYSLKTLSNVASVWFSGWFVKPFSGLPALAGVIGSLFTRDNKSHAKSVIFGVAAILIMFSIIIPLLSGADMVFGYYVGRMVGELNLSSVIGHGFVILTAFALFYSFLWNIGFGRNETAAPMDWRINTIVCGMVLTALTLLYVIFCGLQFTYLFAGAGLPAGMTYSEYAREGFAQTVAVCGINMMMFGIFLQFGGGGKLIKALLGGLLGLTAVMLFSGATRLWLYIDAYGMTWLRLLSGWFIVYLAIAASVCAVKLVWKRNLPALVICALTLLGWYVVLGYLNPDGFIEWYNGVYK